LHTASGYGISKASWRTLRSSASWYLYPSQHARLKSLLGAQTRKYVESLQGSRAELEEILSKDSMLKEQEVHVAVTGRMKELYPLWVKMDAKSTDELPADVVALRVVLELAQRPEETDNEWKTRGVWLCYHVLGLVQHLPDCRPVPSQVKDYISFPKPNGYQSLHTSIIRKGQTIEVQIRTNWMHSVAEFGMAAHWLYKDDRYGSGGSAKLFNKYQVAWMETIKEWQDEIHNSTEFVDAIRRELLGKRVFVFLRNGKILNLSRGATIIDAAFAIHTEVGLTMVGAQINGRKQVLSYELQNGDVVSIVTSPEGRPSLDWMRFARSRSTRAKLRAYFRSQQRAANVQKGWIVVLDFIAQHTDLVAAQHGKALSRQEISELMEEASGDSDEYCVGLTTLKHYELEVSLAELLSLNHDEVKVSARVSHVEGSMPDGWASWEAQESALEAQESALKSVEVEPCSRCMPVPGDHVVTPPRDQLAVRDHGPTILHRPACPEVHEKPLQQASWLNAGAATYPVELEVLCVDRKFLLRDVSDAVALEAEIVRTASQTVKTDAVLTYRVMVRDKAQLRDLVDAVMNVSNVTSCERILGDG